VEKGGVLLGLLWKKGGSAALYALAGEGKTNGFFKFYM
jgi:hypothetical protein